MKLSSRSEHRLVGVHPDLVKCVRKLAEHSTFDFVVIEGLRTAERQAELFKAGATKTLNSRHLTGHAVDIAPLIAGQVTWAWPPYYPLAAAMKEASALLKVPITWGGDWPSFRDAPHWELPWKEYPA